MNTVAQLWRLLRQRGEPPVIMRAKATMEESQRIDAHVSRVLRDTEASDWLSRDRPLEADHFRDRRRA